jgi:hypothetical protein
MADTSSSQQCRLPQHLLSVARSLLLARTTWPHARIKAVLCSTRSTSPGATARPNDAASYHEPPASSSATHAELLTPGRTDTRSAPEHHGRPRTGRHTARRPCLVTSVLLAAASPVAHTADRRASCRARSSAGPAGVPPTASLSRPSSGTKCWKRPGTRVPRVPPRLARSDAHTHRRPEVEDE